MNSQAHSTMIFPTGPGQNHRMSPTTELLLGPKRCCVCRAGEKITVTPSSKELLFYPPEVEATITGGELLHAWCLYR